MTGENENPTRSRRAVLGSLAVLLAGGLGFFLGRVSVDVEPVSDAPLIGIASLASDGYVRAVRESGGIPLVLPNADGSPEKIDDYLELLDGLLMPGGADIPPSEYGEEPHETVEVLDDDRYQFEKALGTAWIKKTDKPLFGICLGGQWINVLSGGSLIQDIPSELGTVHRDTDHLIELEEDSRLAGIFGVTSLEVNSSHHQAVKEVGDGLRIVARSPDGVVEAIETTDPDRFLVGVQWHPERMMESGAEQRALLRAFVEASKKSRVR
ncbi:MAG: gamma-glutamyl-gamma-aminobutyrate hydrolase family protein [Verrucomicrobiota bacterium]